MVGDSLEHAGFTRSADALSTRRRDVDAGRFENVGDGVIGADSQALPCAR